MDLNSTKMFVHVISKGSFSQAAKSLGIPVATVSRRVAELESELNLRLIERSTRKLRLTESGAVLYEFAARGLEEMEAGLLALTDQQAELRGNLRFSLPPGYEPMWNILESFQQKFSNINIEIFVSERRLDFIEDGVDVSLRIGSIDSLSSVARLLHKYRHKLVAANKYIQNNQKINSPKDLSSHSIAVWGVRKQNQSWQLGDQKMSFIPRISANDYLLLRKLVLSGEYITELPEFLCKSQIESGELVELLKPHPLPEQEINLVYPSRKQISRITRVFIDYCVENFKNYI